VERIVQIGSGERGRCADRPIQFKVASIALFVVLPNEKTLSFRMVVGQVVFGRENECQGAQYNDTQREESDHHGKGQHQTKHGNNTPQSYTWGFPNPQKEVLYLHGSIVIVRVGSFF
jgi:hypothetical protein